MNEIKISGKVFQIYKQERSTRFSLMFEFDKEKGKGSFINVVAVKDAHSFMENVNEKEYIIVKGAIKQDEWGKEGKNSFQGRNDVLLPVEGFHRCGATRETRAHQHRGWHLEHGSHG